MDKQTAINKIRKCLALAKSSEPHEAAAALRQAQKMMEQFGVEHPELLAAGVMEAWVKSAATKTPARYEVVLASLVTSAFCCDLMFTRRLSTSGLRIEAGYAFIGVAPMPEVAIYTYTVLRRQLRVARASYIKTALKRYRKNKSAAADLFCEGWLMAVSRLIDAAVPTADQVLAIDAYMRANYATAKTTKPRAPAAGRGVQAGMHKASGYIAGKDVALSKGVGTGASVAVFLE